MKRTNWALAVCAAALLSGGALVGAAQAEDVVLYDGQHVASILYDPQMTTTLAARMLQHDLASLTGHEAALTTDITQCAQVCVIIGAYDSPLITQIARDAGVDTQALKDQWERYERVAISAKGKTYLLIAGSDRRGTVYGVVDLTRELGVSAWEWWADVAPRKVDHLSVKGDKVLSDSPSVQYRGLFLNDEDWGLEPWAAKTNDPGSGTIGPKTYARIYELMWRLKADTIWPAMHDVTTPFYADLNNPKLADDYAIVVGSSHAEPMLRNNTREWDEKTMGRFNFLTNRDRMISYWQQRATQSKSYESLYTIGLRGTGDGPMEGANTPEERKAVLQDVQGVERDILSKTLNKPANTIPQAFTVYKEVEEAYNAGLKLPDDITLVWCDDNYGYLTRLSNAEEQKRSGGAGIYYHISYWGRPHDYLWLSTTHPGLIKEEMGRAFSENARKEWILNVGDIKPGEYLTQYFMDLAFDHKTFDETPRAHLQAFMAQQFGAEAAPEIAAIMMRYYDLAFERKPEFMGWDQTEPTTPTHASDYVQSDGEEAQARLAAYVDLTARAEKVAASLPADRQDAFFELVLYPVRSAANLNTRILKLDLAGLYAHQGRASANIYSDQAKTAQAQIVSDTAAYNALQNGKWNRMMDMAPRKLPVFEAPVYPHWSELTRTGCGAAVPLNQQFGNERQPLSFQKGKPGSQIVTLFGYQAKAVDWTLSAANPAYKVSATSGTLNAANAYEQRLTVSYDGSEAKGGLSLSCGGQAVNVAVQLTAKLAESVPGEDHRIIAIPVASAEANAQWEAMGGLGSQGSSLRSKLDLAPVDAAALAKATPLTYHFTNSSAVSGQLQIVALPTHPLTPNVGLRLGVSLDGAPVQVLDFATVGRSDEWRNDVLSNTAVRTIALKVLPTGDHQLRVYAMDPGFILDRIEIDLDGAAKHYGAVAAGD